MKMLAAEEGKEGRIETEADQCQVITDNNEEEYGEHADKEMLKENVDRDPKAYNEQVIMVGMEVDQKGQCNERNFLKAS